MTSPQDAATDAAPEIPSTGLNDTANNTHLTAVGNTENEPQESQNEEAVQKLKIEEGTQLADQPPTQGQMGSGNFDPNIPGARPVVHHRIPSRWTSSYSQPDHDASRSQCPRSAGRE